MAPATIGMAAVQVNIFASTYFASYEEGAVAWLSYAFRILYLPIGIFGVAVGTVAATSLAHQAASNDTPALRDPAGRILVPVAEFRNWGLAIPAEALRVIAGGKPELS